MRRSLPALLFLPALLAVLLLAACGDDSGGQQSNKNTPATTATDEEYLKVICSGTQAFSDAVVSQTSAEGIARSIKDFIAALKEVTPPQDLQAFHRDITKYLEDAVGDPTSLITKKRPQPDESVRQRLAAREANVPECVKVHYFVTN